MRKYNTSEPYKHILTEAEALEVSAQAGPFLRIIRSQVASRLFTLANRLHRVYNTYAINETEFIIKRTA